MRVPGLGQVPQLDWTLHLDETRDFAQWLQKSLSNMDCFTQDELLLLEHLELSDTITEPTAVSLVEYNQIELPELDDQTFHPPVWSLDKLQQKMIQLNQSLGYLNIKIEEKLCNDLTLDLSGFTSGLQQIQSEIQKSQQMIPQIKEMFEERGKIVEKHSQVFPEQMMLFYVQQGWLKYYESKLEAIALFYEDPTILIDGGFFKETQELTLQDIRQLVQEMPQIVQDLSKTRIVLPSVASDCNHLLEMEAKILVHLSQLNTILSQLESQLLTALEGVQDNHAFTETVSKAISSLELSLWRYTLWFTKLQVQQLTLEHA
ncbi:hypothetical protein EDD86DRAFT_87609 [Gorgonomyces haynaldii]|nr:hypothetical protein EDD86DRAFT_87609 [Gorgonomyces haynaldii]